MERGLAFRVVALETTSDQPFERDSSPDTLTLGTFTIATAMITKICGHREIVATEIASAALPGQVLQGAHGGMRLMSVLELQPGHVGFFKVVSTRVQCSPLRPQFPGREGMSGAFNSRGRFGTVPYRFEDNCKPNKAVNKRTIPVYPKISTHAIAPISGSCEV
jgi:hypothetical protein